MDFGLLLPHFGMHSSRQAVLDGAQRAEALGFDSVFARDHLVYEPHAGIEDDDPTFYDPLITLTAVGARTERIALGTGALIPFRNPLHLARMLGTMIELVGPRIQLGFGTGRFDREFAAARLADVDRLELLKQSVTLLRELGAGGPRSHDDGVHTFEGVSVDPRPAPLDIWYAGGSPASARLAVDLGLGWLPGRITLETIRLRRSEMAERAAAAGGTTPRVGVIAPTAIAPTRPQAMEGVNVDGLLAWANDFGRWWVKPPSGRFERAEDLRGSLIAGAPDDIVVQVEEFRDAGVDHLVFDLRGQFDRWAETIELLGGQVLPAVHRAG